jgi:phage protein D
MPSKPTIQLKPMPTIEVGGQPQPGLSANLLRFSVYQDIHGMHRCEAVFNNWGDTSHGNVGFLYFDRSLLDFGKQVAVKLSSGTIMDGIVAAIGGNFAQAKPPELTVVLEDRFAGFRLTSHTQTYEHLTDADLVQRIAARHGLEAVIEYQGPTIKTISQLAQSDLSFLRARARICNAELWLAGSQLHFRARPNSDADVRLLAYGQTLHSFTVSADMTSQPSQVIGSAWDVATKSATFVASADPAISSFLRGGTSGLQIATSRIGQRVLSAPLVAPSAQVQADAVLRSHAQRFVVGQGTADADARIVVGANIKLSGLGPLFSGHYYISEVNHVFDTQTGTVTNFTAECASIGQTQ